jgi:hypothetical protein
MQTPISFAIDILLDCDTIEKAHKLCRKYIKDLERAPANQTPQVKPKVIHGAPQQPSTMKLLEEMEAQTGAPVVAAAPPALSAAGRIVGGQVKTPGGATGPRKW